MPMLRHVIRASSIVLLVAAYSAEAWSQTEPPQGSPPHSLSSPQDAEAKKALQTPSGKAGKEEPSSHTPAADTTMVLVNGSLNVPGAPQDTDTVPAKYSKQNAADDKLITLAYTFKRLSSDQRQAIYTALKDEPAVVSPSAQIGDVLPFAVPTHPIPAQLAKDVPVTQSYHFLVSDDRVLLISPVTRIVVGVFTGTTEATTGVGGTVQ
jgi:hypothetical protein